LHASETNVCCTGAGDVFESWLMKFIDVVLLPGAGIITTRWFDGVTRTLQVLLVVPAVPVTEIIWHLCERVIFRGNGKSYAVEDGSFG